LSTSSNRLHFPSNPPSPYLCLHIIPEQHSYATIIPRLRRITVNAHIAQAHTQRRSHTYIVLEPVSEEQDPSWLVITFPIACVC
jgi:hypothetical protein